LYVDIVKEYCNINRQFVDEFAALLDKEDLTAAKRKAHTLKGAAGNISAEELHLAAEALENACSGDDVKKIAPILADVAEKLKEILDTASRLDTLIP
jgi:HPt (histidine-containing phosphotransfer) domain-containing protein